MGISPSYMEFEYPSFFPPPSPYEKMKDMKRSYGTKHHQYFLTYFFYI